MFTYIKPEFMIHTFTQQRDNVLNERSLCVARLNDYAIQMAKVDDSTFSLSLENASEGATYAGKVININNTNEASIALIVDDLFRRMQAINEKEIFDMRENIWKWYALSWLEEQDISLEDYLDSRMGHSYEEMPHWKSFEEYMADDYLSIASTMNIINKYAQTPEESEKYRTFAAKDIVEVRQRHSLDIIQKEFAAKADGYEKKKTYGFGIEIVADSRNEAREKLEALLKDTPVGEFIIRG